MRRAVRQTVSRRNKARVLMSENASNIPLDDEDILDLTVVAEPGKPVADRPDAFPDPDAPGEPMDFGADLDALLDSLGAGGSAPAAQAAPIADQTPVDHAVDPDEKMALPEMADIDSLLAELGVDVPNEAQPEPDITEIVQVAPNASVAPKAPVAAKAPSAPLSEFDTLLAQAQKAEAEKAGDAAGDAGGPLEEGDTDLDLNELDALLDDILASAPETGTPPARTTPPAPVADVPAVAAPAEQVEETPVIPVPEQALVPPPPDFSADIAALLDRVERIEEARDLSLLAQRVQAIEATQESSGDMPADAPGDLSGDVSALTERVQRLEESVGILESNEMSESMVEGFIKTQLHATIEDIFTPGSLVMDRICGEIRRRLAEGDLSESLEKMAAAAAAKVIREEIAGLMEEN